MDRSSEKQVRNGKILYFQGARWHGLKRQHQRFIRKQTGFLLLQINLLYHMTGAEKT